MNEKEISLAVIKRLPRYYRYLGELREKGVERISSKELSEQMQVTASQIRQDLNNFGGFGQQGYGYNVEYLYEEIGKILGLDRNYRVIIVGAGNLGQALSNYSDFAKRGFLIEAIFDVKPELIGKKVGKLTVRDASEMEVYVTQGNCDIAALTLPKENAPGIAAKLVAWGIKAIWNFAPTDLNVPDHIVLENVHLAESLMRISYNLTEKLKR